jgi:hypothetical protein
MAAMFSKHVAQIEAWLAEQRTLSSLCHYNEVLKDPRSHAEKSIPSSKARCRPGDDRSG